MKVQASLFIRALALFCALVASSAIAQSAKVEVLWLNQAAFRITTPGGKVIITDPWLLPRPGYMTPVTPPQYRNLEALGKVDVLLVTHAHPDHISEAPAIAKMHNIRLWGAGDLNMALNTLGVLPPAQLPRFGVGGRITPAPDIKVTSTYAQHSSVYVWNNPATGKDETHPAGEAVGFIIELENGFRIWHMGDTGLFSDMKFIAEYYKPDLVLIPIGGHFVMDPVDAAYALRELIRPKYAIPMHYGTSALTRGTPQELIKALGDAPVKVIALKPGEKAEF